MDSVTGRLKKRPVALKVVPCNTVQQRALLDREADNLRALNSQQVAVPYAPVLFDQYAGGDGDICQGTLAMRYVLHAKSRRESLRWS